MKTQDFAEKVIELVKLVPKGKVCTYGKIAQYIGTGGSARTVGYVLRHSLEANNIPAHRIVNAVGLLSGSHAFSQENPMAQMLQNEGLVIENMKVQNFKNHLWDPNIEL